MKKTIACSLLALSVINAQSQLRLPKIFGDSMVLQRNAPLRVWGWAAPAEAITVQFHQQQRSVKADAAGNWEAVLQPEQAGGPYELQVKGKTAITLHGILMGDVWVCSGQSNMEMPVKGWSQVVNADQEIAAANYPSIRLFTVEKSVEGKPATDLKGGAWQTCNPQSIPPFSAVGYFFGRTLNQQLHVPIGLINSTWGGTDIESWISRKGFESEPYYKWLLPLTPEKSTADMTAMKDQQMQAYLASMQLNNLDTASIRQWPSVEFDDSQWRNMNVPELWESQLPGPKFDGVIWLRKEIIIDEADAGKPAVLHVGMIDDNDVTYVNGVQVGAIQGYNVKRVYNIAGSILKKGKNIIAVRVQDTGGGGGIYGEAADCALVIDGKTISLAGSWKFRIESVQMSTGVGPNDYPSVLYNAMIHPIEKLAVKGAIWYQGENNASRAYEYRKAMPLLITDWRMRWQQPAMPFYFVQLTSFNAGNGNSNKGSYWAELREAQTMAAALPNTGMAVTIDVGDPKDIHPHNKQDVGKRLALLALQKTYGVKGLASGPVYKSMQVKGNSVVLQFINTGKGLSLSAETGVTGFEVAGVDQHFYPAKATITGTTVIVSAPEVTTPVAVRYGWADDDSEAALFNKDGFPAAPFRTDNWRSVTEGKKYAPPLMQQ
jgi:sialate O-acetylesterase